MNPTHIISPFNCLYLSSALLQYGVIIIIIRGPHALIQTTNILWGSFWSRWIIKDLIIVNIIGSINNASFIYFISPGHWRTSINGKCVNTTPFSCITHSSFSVLMSAQFLLGQNSFCASSICFWHCISPRVSMMRYIYFFHRSIFIIFENNCLINFNFLLIV